MTHGGGMIGSHRHRLWHIIQGFLTCPPAPAAWNGTQGRPGAFGVSLDRSLG